MTNALIGVCAASLVFIAAFMWQQTRVDPTTAALERHEALMREIYRHD